MLSLNHWDSAYRSTFEPWSTKLVEPCEFTRGKKDDKNANKLINTRRNIKGECILAEGNMRILRASAVELQL